MSDIEHWTMEDLKHHFAMGYSPSNSTMVVVGDVTPEEVFAFCEKYIEPIPSHAPPPPVTTTEPEQQGERRLVVHKPAELPLLMLAYHVPQTNNPDFYALNVLQTILFHGESSRMYQRLVDKDQIALEVNSEAPTALDPTLSVIVVQPKEGVDPKKCEKAIYEELERAKTGQ
jgi:zinc protease